MSIKIIQQQIERFLVSEAPEVLSLKGAWGVGKTHAWNKCLTEVKNQNKVALGKYSYVSLFGINSLDDLKFAIFEHLVDRRTIGRKPTVESFKANASELLDKLGSRSFAIRRSDPLGSDRLALLRTLSFLSLEKAIICIDDFERKGKGIAAQDVLGLITQLKEQKKCKIALILNDESLSEDASTDYARLREKVIDTELRLDPTAEDCVEIALNRGRLTSLLGANIVQLKINNIRIIKKIEKLSASLAPLLKKFDDQVLELALRVLTLLVWCYYSRSSEVPDYNFVLSRMGAFSDLDDEVSLTTQQQSWCAILRNYDNFTMNDFGLQIARLVENGYADEKRLLAAAAILHDEVLAARSEGSFQEAWQKFNESFDDNAQDVINCLSDSFKHNAKYITPVNLDGAVRLLRCLGKDQLATRIIALYIEKRQAEPELFNLDSTLLPGQIRDWEVIEKFAQKQQSLRAKRPLRELCEQLLQNDSYSDEEELLLAQATVEEYLELFKKEKGPRLSLYIDLCLQFSRLGGTTESQKLISDKATEALQRIGRESRLNASRVKRFGVRID